MMPDSDDMTCQELVEAHLLDCDECPIYLEQIRVTIRAVGVLTEHQMSQLAREDLLRHISTWKRDRGESPPVRH